jgi:hypothetical protein
MSSSSASPSRSRRAGAPASAVTFRAALLGILCLGILTLVPSAVSAAPPAPSKPTASCDASVGGHCYVNGAFTLSSYSSGAHHYQVCRSNDTTGWGGCSVVMTTNSGSSYTVSGSDLPSDGFRRAYYFRACDAANDCTRWADNDETYVYMDLTGPTAPGATSTTCLYQSSGCWVRGTFTASVTPASDSGSGVGSYQICRSHDSTGGFAGCQYNMTTSGGTSFTVSGSNLPSDGYRRAYWFRGKDQVGNAGAWNTPLYVRVDRHNPTVSATNASNTWFASRTVTITGADDAGGAAANSGLVEVRHRWNAPHNGSCTTGTVSFSGELLSGVTLTVPEGDNHLYVCARDNIGRVGYWNGGPYRVDTSPPLLGSLTISSSIWNIDDGSTYSITGTVTDSGSGVHEIRNRINVQGSNSANERGLFAWRLDTYRWSADHIPCTGGGFASKHPTVANPGTVTLVGCSTSLTGSSRTVTFTVRPNETFGEFGPINDISMRAGDTTGNWVPWKLYDLNFSSVTHPPTVSANNASSTWFKSRSATVTASAYTGSTLQAVRYLWNAAHNAACTSGTATSNGAALAVPAGDNHLYLCAKDSLGRVGRWDGGPYRVDTTPPLLGSLTISSTVWNIDDGSTYGITATATDPDAGVRELRTRINIQGSNTTNERGLFAWRADSYVWSADQIPCTGGGFASKHPTAANPGTVTLVGCTTSLTGSARTVTFTVLPNETFGEFGPINDISMRAGDTAGNWVSWILYDLNFSSRRSLHPDFSLAITPASRTVPRLRSRTYTVTVNGQDGFSSPVALSISGLPAGVTASFSPASVSPGSASTLTLQAAADAALVTRTFTVTGTGGGKSHTVQAGVTVTQNEPIVSSVTPDPIQRGAVRTLTIHGAELMDATVYVATEPYDATTPVRTYPTVQSATVSADGKRLTVSVDVSSAAVDGFYNLGIETPGGETAGQFRVVGPEPVVDMWTPSEPITGRVHVFAAVGENLQGAQVIPLSGGVRVLDLDNSDPHSLTGLLFVAAGTGDTQLRIRGTGGDVDLPLRPRIDMAAVTKQTSRVELQGTSSGADPEILIQEPTVLVGGGGAASSVVRNLAESSQDGELANRAEGLVGCLTLIAGRRISFSAILLSLFDENNDPLTQAILDALVPGSSLRIHSTTLAITGFLEFEFVYRLCSYGASDLYFCVRGGIAVMVPGVGGQSFTFDICAGLGGVWTDLAANGFITNFGWSSSSPCVQARDLGGLVGGIVTEGSQVGNRAAEIEMTCCDSATLSAQIQGQVFGGNFNVGGEVIDTHPVCLHGDRYDIEVRAFIPFNFVGPADLCTDPIGRQQTLVFEGDDRGYRADPPLNFRGLPSYRMQQKVSVYADKLACDQGLCNATGLVPGSFSNSTGETASYAEDALYNETPGLTIEDYDGIPFDCHLWHESGRATIDGWSTQVTRIHEKRVQVRFIAAGANPITSIPAPDIDWDITVTLDEDLSVARWEVSGRSDCFPAYEVYINNKQVAGFLPPDGGIDRVALCLPAPMDITYTCNGDFESPTPPACFPSP